MNPRFDNPLYFQPDRSLEVCGPTNLHKNVSYMTITRLKIDDGSGNVQDRTGLSVVALQTAQMWETYLPDMKPPCVPSSPAGTATASGHAEATLTMTDGTTQQISWDGNFALI